MAKGRPPTPNELAALKKHKAPQWVKGQSGNPAGLAKGTKHRATILKELMDIILKQNGKPVSNPLDPDEKKITIEKAMQVKMIEKALKGDIQAYQLIMDTVYGKNADVQAVQIETFNHNAEMSPEELKAELESRGLPTEIFQK